MKVILSVALLMCLAMVYSQTNMDLNCPVPDKENATLLPNPTNCNNYFTCVNGEPIPMRCPKGLHFNPELSVCDWPGRAHCTANNK